MGTGLRERETRPRYIPLQEHVYSTACGDTHTLVLAGVGSLYGAGGNARGQLGLGHKRSLVEFAHNAEVAHIRMSTVCAGGSHSAAVSVQGELYIWGTGSYGEFVLPHRVKTIKGKTTQVSLGATFGAALNDRGVAYTWGENKDGELGVGDYNARMTPFPVVSL